jgi:hypothetical protein
VKRPPLRTGIELDFGLNARCIGCKAEREPEGRKLLSEGSTFIVQTDESCICGERRVKVRFSLDVL